MVILPRTRFVAAPLLPLTVALGAGVTVQHLVEFNNQLIVLGLLVVTLSASIACLFLLREQNALAATLILLLAFLCTGVLLARFAGGSSAPNRIFRMYDADEFSPDDPVELTGVVSGEPEPAPQSFYFELRVERLTFQRIQRDASGTVLLLAHTPTQNLRQEYDALELHHGARIRVLTKLDREDDFRNPGVPAFTEYLERKGYEATGTIKSPLLIERLDEAAVFLPVAWVYRWRAWLQSEFGSKFSAETAGVLNAALLGNPYNISSPTAERFRAGGTFHILVISGLQIAFIAGGVFFIVRRMTHRRLFQFLFAALFLWAYAIAVGAEVSVTRAALMFTLAAFAPVVTRHPNSLNTLAAAGLLLIVLNPINLFDPSFQLTFLSVVAIVCVAVPLIDNMRRVGTWKPTMVTPYPPACPSWFRKLAEALFWSEREWRTEMIASNIRYRLFKAPIAAKLERWLIQKPLRYTTTAIVISASVQIVLLPLTIIYFHRVSIASIFLNIFVGILMAVLGLAALAAMLVSQVSTVLAAPLVEVAEQSNWLMVHLVDPFSDLGLAAVRLPHYSGWAAMVYVFYFAALGVLIFAFSRWNPLRALPPHGLRARKTLRTVAIAFGASLLVVLLHPFSTPRWDGSLHVEFLDVGQGDCALLTTPDGITILIDGGGRPGLAWRSRDGQNAEPEFERDTRSIGERVVSEYLWARGLDRVDYLISTHADADHIDGLNDVVRNFKVRGVIVARAPADDPEFAKFTRTVNQTGVPVEIVGAGDAVRVGELSMEVLWPKPAQTLTAPSGNNDSMVLKIRFGEKSLLLTADVEKEAESALVRAGVDLRSDVVKVPHHGSKTSSIEKFVDAVRPTFAVISVGRRSIFGHPNKEVVERWRASGAHVMTTGEKGTISVVSDGNSLTVSTFVR